MTETITFEVTVRIGYETLAERKAAIKDARECVTAQSINSGTYYARPGKAKLLTPPQASKNK